MEISVKNRIRPYITRRCAIKAAETEKKCANLRNRHYVDLVTIRGLAEQVLGAIHDMLDEVATMEHTLLDRETPPPRKQDPVVTVDDLVDGL